MTAALAQIPATKQDAPLPAEIDSRAESFHQLELDLAEARKEMQATQRELAQKELALIELVRACGGPHAQKSKILHGIAWEIVATFSQYTTQDSAAVERFRQALLKAKKTRLLKKIFTQDVRWTMSSGAAEIVKTEKLSPTLMSLLLQCSVTGDKKPSLDVRPKKKPAV
jgi:hypothetical protein